MRISLKTTISSIENWSTADRILFDIGRKKPSQQTELVTEYAGRTQQNVSRIIKELRRRGLLEEGKLSLTGKGLQNFKKLQHRRHKSALAELFDEELDSGWTDDQDDQNEN